MSASAAAAERRRKLRQEEELMTTYRRDELDGNWEFKIIRSATASFGDANMLQATLQQETVGGWELLEKFDNERVRLRRPMSARKDDMSLPRGYDPYRTQVGISEGALVLWVILGFTLVIGGVMWVLLANGVIK